MSQLLETIKCKDGKLYNLKYHQTRFENSRKEFFSCTDKIDLSDMILVPKEYKSGLFRCRVIYSKKIDKIEFLPHHYNKVESLKVVVDNRIDYHLKYLDRTSLFYLFEQRESCDDILIIKNNCISDSYTANPIFFDGIKWWTSDTPLLPGTQRAKLIEEGKISICHITTDDLLSYKKVGLINALQDMENMPVVSIENII